MATPNRSECNAPRSAHRRIARRSRVAMTLAAALAGSVFVSACGTQIREAFVSNAKDVFFATFFGPEALANILGVDSTASENQ